MTRKIQAIRIGGLAALSVLAMSGAASAVTDTQIPLNYNWHAMERPGEGFFSISSVNSDNSANQYRAMADRGFVFDLTDPNALGSLPIVGATGIPYSLYNSLGYGNATNPSFASANNFDAVLLANRVLNASLEHFANQTTQSGPFPTWSPSVAITSLSASAGSIATSPALVTATTSAPHGFKVGDTVLVGGADPSVTGNAFAQAHPFNGSYTILAVPAPNQFTYVTSTANVTGTAQRFVNNIPASGLSVASGVVTVTTNAPHGLAIGQQVTVSGVTPVGYGGLQTVTGTPTTTTFTYNSATTGTSAAAMLLNNATTISALTGNTTTVTATTGTTAHGLTTGSSATVTGSSVMAYNGTYTVTVPTASISSITSTTTTATATTSGAIPFTSGQSIAVTGASVANHNVTSASVTVPTANISYMSGNGSTVSVRSLANSFVNGQQVTISGAYPAAYNGTYTITVVDTTNFTFSSSATGAFKGTALATSANVFTYPITSTAGTSTGTMSATTPFVFTYALANQGTMTVRPSSGFSGEGFALTSLQGNGSAVTGATGGVAHNFTVGQSITIANAVPASYNGTFTITALPTTTSFQYADTNTAATRGSYMGAGTLDTASSDQVTTLSTPLTVGGASQVGVLFIGSNSGGQFDTVLTFGTGPSATNVSCRFSAPDWCGNNADSAIVSGQPVVSQSRVTHPIAAQITSLSGDTATVTAETGVTHGFAVGNPVTISGDTSNSYNGTFTVATIGSSTSSMVATTGLIGNGSVATATTSAAHSFAVGQQVFVSGATPATLNGIYTVTTVPDTTHFTYANTTNAASTSASTATRNFFTFAAPNTGTSAGTIWGITTAATYTSFRGGQNTDSNQITPMLTTANAGCANLRLTEGVMAVPGNVAGQQLTKITFKNATWNNSLTMTALSGTGTFATGTVSSTTGYLPGQVINIRGVVPAAYNGTYTIASVPNSTTFTFATTATGTVTTQGTIDRNGGGRGWSIHAATLRNNAQQPANNLPTTATVAHSGIGAAGDNFGTLQTAFDGFTTTTGGGADYYGVWYAYTATGSSAHMCEARTCLDGQDVNLTPEPFKTGVTGVRTVAQGTATPVLPLDTTIAVYGGSSASPVFIAGNDNGCNVSSRVQWTATPGVTYFIRVASKIQFGGTNAQFYMHIDDPVHTDLTMPLQFNWNGICHGTAAAAGPNFFSEQCVLVPQVHENRSDQNGYRSISDRGLLFDPNNTTQNAFNYGGTVGYQGLVYTLYDTALQSDMVHLGIRTSKPNVANPIWMPGNTVWTDPTVTNTTTMPSNGILPLWLPGDYASGTPSYDHSTATSSMTGLNATFGDNTKIGLIYHMTNIDSVTPQVFGTFTVTLAFADGSTFPVQVQGTDWYGGQGNAPPFNQTLPAAPLTGVEAHRILGIYNGVQNWDRADTAPNDPLKVVESVISTASLTAAGFDPRGRGILTSITFSGITSNNTATNVSIFAATIRDPASFNLNFGPSGVGTVTPNMLTVGASGRMTVSVSRGSGSPNNITSVTVDASALGLSSTFALNDSGINGDQVANNNVWSANVGFPVNATPGAFSVPFTVTDAQSRTAMGNIIFTLVGPTGSATPNPVNAGQNTLLRVTLSPTTGGPADISSVVVDGSSVGLASNIALNDTAANGDATNHDGIWSRTVTIPANALGQTVSLPVTITDVSARSASGTISLTVIGPPVASDLGTLAMGPTNFSGTIDTAGQVKWIKFTTTAPIDASTFTFLDIDTEGSALTTLNDTEIGIYDSNGNLVVSDDDSGSGNLSQLSFGLVCPARAAVGDGLAYNGRNGTLPPGTYYLAYTGFNATFNATGWSVTSASTYTGTFNINFNKGMSAGGGGAPTAQNLGNVTAASTTPQVINATGTIGAGGTAWFKFTLTADINGAVPTLQYLDIDTEGSAVLDTTIALFRDDGNGTLVNTDDDDGSGTYSQFSYGRAGRPAVGDGVAYNGRDGATLTAGTYYVAVSEHPAGFCNNFVVGFNTGPTAGSVNLNIRAGLQSPIINGPLVFVDNGHTYYLLTNGFNWQQAEDYAVQQLGGHLAQIEDSNENNFIAFNVIPFDGFNHDAFIGLWDPSLSTVIPATPAQDTRPWTWTTGQPFGGFINWAAGEPNNGPGAAVPGQEHYGQMFSGTGFWNDINISGAAGSTIYAVIEVGGGGVCCRGATCNTTVSQASCTASGTAGAAFIANASTCNSGPVSSTPCCHANYNKVGGITVQDIFDFLGDWFAGNPYANVGGNGSAGPLTVQNIFDFLSDWFAGGCN